ncbi:hypothetical protein [Cohnella fermenti]|uniref:Uncharacterized protein n=1 Tax=Cohnella fermenti TaxID=2565925 RepID=A0A4S4C4K5_9BACL|nr:hypothetical protein [Cohnella fermenti]THF82726.1 hypothetical protein E6C55_06600 [Cohnella fermenti]
MIYTIGAKQAGRLFFEVAVISFVKIRGCIIYHIDCERRKNKKCSLKTENKMKAEEKKWLTGTKGYLAADDGKASTY